MTSESDEMDALKEMAIVAGEKAVALDDREVRGIFIDEEQIAAEVGPKLRCRLFGHAEPKRERLLNHNQKIVGLADYCPRCWCVLNKETFEDA